MNLIVFTPVVNLTSSASESYDTVSTLPVQVAFSLGGNPAGIKIIPLAFPFSSVTTGPLKADKELPAIPVYLKSGLTQREISCPSIKTWIFVFGFNLLTVNLTGILLAKNDKEVPTTLEPTPLVEIPLPISLFCGLMFEELPTEALVTLESATLLLTSENDPILKNALFAPNQLTL